jgi:hypothetical protein
MADGESEDIASDNDAGYVGYCLLLAVCFGRSSNDLRASHARFAGVAKILPTNSLSAEGCREQRAKIGKKKTLVLSLYFLIRIFVNFIIVLKDILG